MSIPICHSLLHLVNAVTRNWKSYWKQRNWGMCENLGKLPVRKCLPVKSKWMAFKLSELSSSWRISLYLVHSFPMLILVTLHILRPFWETCLWKVISRKVSCVLWAIWRVIVDLCSCMKTGPPRISLTFKNCNLPSQNNHGGRGGRTHFIVHGKAANYILHQKPYFSGYLYCQKWIMIDCSLSLNCYILN